MTSYLSNGSHKAHAISQGIQLLSLLCCTTFHLPSMFRAPSIYQALFWCRRLDSEQENQILEALALSGAPLFRFGNERKDTPPHICLLPDRASLSTDAFAAPPSISPVTQSLSHESVFGSLPLVYLPLSPRSLSVHLPEGFVPSFMPSMHGDIFPHLSHRVLSARVFFLSPTFIREQKPFSLLLRQTFFFNEFCCLIVSPHFIVLF